MPKIKARFQFYLPFVIPRANDWETKSIGMQRPDFTVIVRPRNLDEELFPEDIDKTLSAAALTLNRTSKPQSNTTMLVRDLCRDRIECTVEQHIDSIELAYDSDFQTQTELRALRAGNQFLDHVRVLCRSAFPLSIERRFRLKDEKYYIITPSTASWFKAESGERLGVYVGGVNGCARSGAVESPERGELDAPWDTVIGSLKTNPSPDLVQSLLLDAEHLLIVLRLREALLTLGTACEIAYDQYFDRKSAGGNPEVGRVNKSSHSFACKRFDLIPRIISQRSLLEDHPQEFLDIERMYRARNNVAHEGRAIYSENNQDIEISPPIAMRLLAASRQAVEWIRAL